MERPYFLGLSVRGFTTNLGWGNQQSQLSITLVQDILNNELVELPPVGIPVFFDYEGYSFNGILQSIELTGAEEGSPLYSAVVVSPNHILEGVQLILGEYSGPSYLSNVLNIFGHLESKGGIGYSSFTDSGIKWTKVLEGINDLINTDNTSPYGSLITYNGFKYRVSCDSFAKLSPEYRITASQMSLLDVLSELADSTSTQFFVALLNTLPYPTIEVVTQDMSTNPNLGIITSFISQTSGAISKRIGTENSGAIASKMILGAKKHGMYYTYGVEPNQNDYVQDYISQYWGVDGNNNVVIPDGLGSFYLNLQHIDFPGIPSLYRTDVEEMKYAIHSQDDWENFLMANSDNKFKEVQLIKEGDTVVQAEGTYVACQYARFYLVNLEFPFKIKSPDGDITLTFEQYDELDADFQKRCEFNYHEPRFMPVPRENITSKLRLDLAKGSDSQRSSFLTALQLIYENLFEAEANDVSDKLAIAFTFGTYRHNGETNIHFGKYDALGAISEVSPYFKSAIQGEDGLTIPEVVENFSMMKVSPFTKSQIKGDDKFTQEKRLKALYEYVANYANTFYGKQYMVRLPFVQSYRDEDTGVVYSNYNPTDSGFIDETRFVEAYNNGLIPQQVSILQNEENKIEAYGRWDFNVKRITAGTPSSLYATIKQYEAFINENTIGKDFYYNGDLSLSLVPDDEYAIQRYDIRDAAFIKGQVEPNFVYLDYENLTDPRAVIVFPNYPFPAEQDDTDGDSTGLNLEGAKSIDNVFRQMITAEFIKKGIDSGDPAYNIKSDDYAEAMKNIQIQVDALLSRMGVDPLNFNAAKTSKYPFMIAIPLESRTERYGPFYKEGYDGKVDFEIDDELNPWNFNSYDYMTAVAMARVNTSTSLQSFTETGAIEYPGVPAVNIGRSLIAGGPYVTNIDVNIGEQGVTTRYDMSIWTPQWGRQSQADIQRVQRLKTREKKDARRQRDRNLKKANSKYFNNRGYALTKRLTYGSTHGMLVGDNVGNVYMSPNYNVVSQIDTNNYEKLGGCSLDNIFTVYSTSSQASGIMPFFGETTSVEQGTVNDLNPFPSGNVTSKVVFNGSEVQPNGLATLSSDYVRSIALKAPLIVAGWGYTVDGLPVAASGDSFHPDYLTDTSLWKAGPVDLRWDDDRQVWAAGGGISAHLVKIDYSMHTDPNFYNKLESGLINQPYSTSGYIMDLQEVAVSGIIPSGVANPSGVFMSGILYTSLNYIQTDKLITVYNMRENILYDEEMYFTYRIKGKYIVDNQATFNEDVYN